MNLFSDWSERLSSYFGNFSEKINDISNNYTSLIGMLGLALLIILLFRFKKVKLTPSIIAQIGLALALSCILQVLRIYHFPMGGSITLGGMVPLLIISFMYGPEIGMLSGFLYGILNLFLDPYFLHPVQVLFDYPLPSIAIGLSGFFKDKLKTGTLVAFSAKFICHFISGIVFFASYAADYGMNPLLYSLVVNGPMVAGDCIICLIIISIIPLNKIISKSKTSLI